MWQHSRANVPRKHESIKTFHKIERDINYAKKGSKQTSSPIASDITSFIICKHKNTMLCSIIVDTRSFETMCSFTKAHVSHGARWRAAWSKSTRRFSRKRKSGMSGGRFFFLSAIASEQPTDHGAMTLQWVRVSVFTQRLNTFTSTLLWLCWTYDFTPRLFL